VKFFNIGDRSSSQIRFQGIFNFAKASFAAGIAFLFFSDCNNTADELSPSG